MSIDFSEKHLTLFQFNDHHRFESRELIDGLQLNKDKVVDEVNQKVARPFVKGSKDTNEIFWKNPLEPYRDELPMKSCLMVPKEEGSTEKIEVRKAKSVHFADSCGLALTSVATLFDNEEELFAFKNFCRNRGLVGRNSFPSFGKPKTVEKRKSKFLNFVQPVSLPNFRQLVLNNKVSLESVVLREYSIFGTVCVANIDFHKNIFLRYTVDKWKSSKDAKGAYVSGTSTGKTDTFSFEIPMSGHGDGLIVEFCVCFETKDGSFWDNNNSQNYKILFYQSKVLSVSHENIDGFVLPPKSPQFAGMNV